jgi:hypothetical protein
MAKITLADGMVIEGTIEELKQMGVKFPVEDEPKAEPLKVGDYAKTLVESKHGYTGTGEIVKIETTDFPSESGHTIAVRNLRGRDGLFKPSELVLATDKEVAEKEIEAKWAKIGREPNEFKKGDAVQYKKAFTVVSEIKPDGIVAINQSNHISKNITVSPEDLTLVFPAEARFE